MKNKLLAMLFATTMIIAIVIAMKINKNTVFAANEYEVVNEFDFKDDKGLLGVKSTITSGEHYYFEPTEVAIIEGRFWPGTENGAVVEETFDGTKGFRVTVTVAFPETIYLLNTGTVFTVVPSKPILGEEVEKNFGVYCIDGNHFANGFWVSTQGQMWVDPHSMWGMDLPPLEMGKEHTVSLEVIPNKDGLTVTAVMTVDGKKYVVPNSSEYIFPNYLTDSMTVIIGRAMFGQSLPYEISRLKIEKALKVVEIPTEAQTTTEAWEEPPSTDELYTEIPTHNPPTEETSSYIPPHNKPTEGETEVSTTRKPRPTTTKKDEESTNSKIEDDELDTEGVFYPIPLGIGLIALAGTIVIGLLLYMAEQKKPKVEDKNDETDE